MEVREFISKDGLPLSYYVNGTGPRTAFITNAPGMSIKFWMPIMNNLMDEYTFYGMEYRGFPSNGEVLEDEYFLFERIVDDFLLIIEREKLEGVHLMSWCVGSKVALNIYKQIPEKILSYTALNFAYKQHDFSKLGTFARLMYGVRDRIDADPGYVDRMVQIMKKMGTIPTKDFLEIVGDEEGASPSFDLYNHIDKQSTLAGISFYLIDTKEGLLNYLKIYQSFGKQSILEIIKTISCPVFVLNGSKDNVVRYHAEDNALMAVNPNIRYTLIEDASHFMMVDIPRKISRLIRQAIESINV
jgi:pimeloyl-ACP methyl ester carboxylesterase